MKMVYGIFAFGLLAVLLFGSPQVLRRLGIIVGVCALVVVVAVVAAYSVANHYAAIAQQQEQQEAANRAAECARRAALPAPKDDDPDTAAGLRLLQLAGCE